MRETLKNSAGENRGGQNRIGRRAVLGAITVIVLRFGLNVIRLDENLIEGVQGIVLLFIVWLTYEKNRTNIYN